jgi:hypothetical protein
MFSFVKKKESNFSDFLTGKLGVALYSGVHSTYVLLRLHVWDVIG